jgi:hypothetical protein
MSAIATTPQGIKIDNDVKLHFDKAEYSLAVGNVRASEFIKLIFISSILSATYFYFRPSFGAACFVIFCIFISWKYSKIHVFWGESSSTGAIGRIISAAIVIFLAQLIAEFTSDWWFISFFTRWIYRIGSVAIVFLALSETPENIASGARRRTDELPRIELPEGRLAEKYHDMKASLEELNSLKAFDIDIPDLADAFAARDTVKIESLLNGGVSQNRTSWDRGLAIFNRASSNVDLARGNLRHALRQSEDAIAQYEIDLSTIDIQKSRELGGWIAEASLAPQTLGQKLSYQQATSQALTKVVTGQAPWQMGAAVVAVQIIMHYVNQSKLMRQLKDFEGDVGRQSVAARADLDQMAILIQTRLMPQFDRIATVIAALQTGIGILRAAERRGAPDQRATAFRLACAIVEARQLLATTAGD